MRWSLPQQSAQALASVAPRRLLHTLVIPQVWRQNSTRDASPVLPPRLLVLQSLYRIHSHRTPRRNITSKQRDRG